MRGHFKQLSNKNVQIWHNFFPLLFPKESESLKILDIRFWEVGAKKRLNGTSKVNTQTDKQTDRRTDILTYRKHWPRGPLLWKLVYFIEYPQIWFVIIDFFYAQICFLKVLFPPTKITLQSEQVFSSLYFFTLTNQYKVSYFSLFPSPSLLENNLSKIHP